LPEAKVKAYEGFPLFSEWLAASADLSPWDVGLARMPEKTHLSEPVLKKALRVALRAAAVDTGAIESLYQVDRGFTVTVAIEGFEWQARMQEQSERTRLLIQAQIEAYERLLDLINTPWPITEAVIRDLHVAVCKEQETYEVVVEVGGQPHRQEQLLPKGEYKRQPNNVITVDGTVFQYCPPDRVAPEMHKLVEVLASQEFGDAHPVLKASWIHYAFILIHPFADGNGRVARLLASLYFCKAASVPFLVFADRQQQYFRSLREADAGNFAGFVQFCARCGQDAFDLVAQSVIAASAPSAEESLQRIKEIYDAVPCLTVEELRTAVIRLMEAFKKSLSEKLQLKGHAARIHEVDFSRIGISESFDPNRGPVVMFSYVIRTQPPVSATVNGQFQVDIPRFGGDSAVALTRFSNGSDTEALIVSSLDVLAVQSPRTRLLIEMGAERAAREILKELADEAEVRKANI
jgi:Fic family protein